MRLKLFVLMLTTVVTMLGATAPPAWSAPRNDETAFRQAKTAYERLLASTGPQRQHRDRWLAVAGRLQGFAERHQTHQKAAEAHYLSCLATEEIYRISRLAADARSAVERYEGLVSAFPQSRYAPDGLWRAGSLSETPLKDFPEAYRYYAQLADRYPRSEHADMSRSRLKALASYAPHEEPAAVEVSPAAAAPGTLNGIRAWTNPGYTRIVLDVSRPTEYTSNLLNPDSALGTPPRLYIDLVNTSPVGGLPEISQVNDGLLQQIRAGRPVPGRTRVVLDLRSFSAYKIFTLPEPFRIVIDITAGTATAPAPAAVAEAPVTPSPAAPVAVVAQVAPPVPAVATPPPTVTVPPPPVSKGGNATDRIAEVIAKAPVDSPPVVTAPVPTTAALRRVVIDAGHGGKDPGAIGPSGLMEKDVTLALALQLAEDISRELDWEVVLTRNDDTFIPLEERTAIANKVGADLFVSIHANASPNAAAHGIETYYLNFSKNEKAAAVAARENGSSLQQVGDLEQILFDLMAHAKIQESSRLASEIQHALVDRMGKTYGQVRDLGVKQGPFYVLLGANMPSVLVEAAFISNQTEETRLASRNFKKHASRAILDGIRTYAASLKAIAQR